MLTGKKRGEDNRTALFPLHGNSALRADEGADTAAFAVVEVDLYETGLGMAGNAQIRAEVPAKLTISTSADRQAAGGCFNSLIFRSD